MKKRLCVSKVLLFFGLLIETKKGCSSFPISPSPQWGKGRPFIAGGAARKEVLSQGKLSIFKKGTSLSRVEWEPLPMHITCPWRRHIATRKKEVLVDEIVLCAWEGSILSVLPGERGKKSPSKC